VGGAKVGQDSFSGGYDDDDLGVGQECVLAGAV